MFLKADAIVAAAITIVAVGFATNLPQAASAATDRLRASFGATEAALHHPDGPSAHATGDLQRFE